MACVWTIAISNNNLFVVGGGDQGYGSGRYDSRPGGYGYGYGYGRSRDYGGRWVTKRLEHSGGTAFLFKNWAAWVFIYIYIYFTVVLQMFVLQIVMKL